MSITNVHPSYGPHTHGYALDVQGTVRAQGQRLVSQWGQRSYVAACPDAEYHWVDRHSGEIGPASRCRRNTCLFCVRVDVRRMARAIERAKPHTMINLTGLSGVWGEDRLVVKRLLAYLRRDGLPVHLAWAIEPNPRGTGHHAHGWAWGARLDQRTLERRCAQVGMGRPHIKPVTHSRNFGYIAKNATHNEESLLAHRHSNGQETIHARRFWRDGESGTPLTKREALTEADAGLWQSALSPSLVLVRLTVDEEGC